MLPKLEWLLLCFRGYTSALRVFWQDRCSGCWWTLGRVIHQTATLVLKAVKRRKSACLFSVFSVSSHSQLVSCCLEKFRIFKTVFHPASNLNRKSLIEWTSGLEFNNDQFSAVFIFTQNLCHIYWNLFDSLLKHFQFYWLNWYLILVNEKKYISFNEITKLNQIIRHFKY